MISVVEMFKVGVGPSSSHTVGPMRAGFLFVEALREAGVYLQTERLVVHLYGSLALTGRGHASDRAVLLGLLGESPDTVDTYTMQARFEEILHSGLLPQVGRAPFLHVYERDFLFHREALVLHENGLCLEAFDAHGALLLAKTYYSIGGGFVVEECDFSERSRDVKVQVPFVYRCAEDFLGFCRNYGLGFADLALRNECALHGEDFVRSYCLHIWQVMQDCIHRGLSADGALPGRLALPRRAPQLFRRLQEMGSDFDRSMVVLDWLNMVAMAVNEENAAGGRVVTAPTNGACGIVPAVLAYYDKFIAPLSDDLVVRYLLVCATVGSFYKMNASISGAEVGCQGEIGVACSMAAAGLTELLGGSPEKVCVAAEIAMEHHLGLTCDPVAGLVQVPCIERNALSTVKAVNAARMALMRTSKPVVGLDAVIKTMYETGRDMNAKYRETSLGGLALHVVC